MKTTKSVARGHIAMVGANVCWGLMSPVAKIVLSVGVISPLLLTDMRVAGAAILFWLTSLFCPREHVPPRDLFLMAGAAMIGILFNQGCFIFGVGLTSPAEASVITTTMPLWVMLLAALILKEPITLKKAGGIAVGATGALILIFGATGRGSATAVNPVLGDLLVFAAQFSYALYLTLYRNFIRRYSMVTLMKWMFTFAALVALPFSISDISATSWRSVDMSTWLGVGFVVVFGTYIAYQCILIGQKVLRPTVVGMYNYLQPVVAAVVAVTIGMEQFTWSKVLAVALIFSGVYLVVTSKARKDS
ncbi:MAG: DMT family transporter [Muribaculum sp.]|nr:DMT family transporter [Muribaculum sp.]